MMVWLVAVLSLAFLACSAASRRRSAARECATGAIRVTFWGALAMALTAGVGSLFGVTT